MEAVLTESTVSREREAVIPVPMVPSPGDPYERGDEGPESRMALSRGKILLRIGEVKDLEASKGPLREELLTVEEVSRGLEEASPVTVDVDALE